ncbi:acyltransferase family protein [Methylomonas fluvii]|uniref:Acyltransferase n=1 Tax=Methylomonas fluvii TaxID=1854564 RepID=A0ABR9D9T3_9GAMM|nr:acyltransferase [Methylomonas fluvii]MBD9359869.1 acyltransferase [Methylomonas fluvii]
MRVREIYLDFIRGVAILLAMGSHFNNTVTNIWFVDLLMVPGRLVGWAGVDLFFVLSGFLIGGLIFNEYKQTGSFKVGRFLIRRGFKIWPVLYFYLFLLLISGRYPWDTFLWQNLLHVQNYFLTPIQHLWSLAVEEHFYLIFAAAIVVVMRLNSINIKVFEAVLPMVLIGTIGLRVWAFMYEINPYSIYIQTQYRIDALAFGIYLAYIKIFYADKFNYIAKFKLYIFLVLISGIFLLVFFRENIFFKATFRYTVSYLSAGSLLLYCYKLKVIDNNNALVRVVAWIGLYSYAMYVYQFVAMRVIYALLGVVEIHEISPIFDLCIKYLGAIFLAVVITKLIEKPSLALRERLFPS